MIEQFVKDLGNGVYAYTECETYIVNTHDWFWFGGVVILAITLLFTLYILYKANKK